MEGPVIRGALNGQAGADWRPLQDPRLALITAAYPIWSGNQVTGAVVIEQTGEAIATIRYAATAQLLNLTLILYYTQVLHPPDGWWELARLLGPLVWLGSTVTDRHRTLTVYGLGPEAEITLVQHQPACVIRIGETELAIDSDIARDILVQPLDSERTQPRPDTSPASPAT